MANILLGWELGANAGHARRLEAVATALLAEGHSLHLAVQNLSALQLPAVAEGRVSLWQAPLWPGLLRHGGPPPLGAPRRFGDVLANLGLHSAAGLAAILQGWEALLDAIGPDAVIGDFAPGLMLAARGRMPRLAVGTGFTVPVSDLPEFPNFAEPGAPPLVAEAALLALVNAALARRGRAELQRLPEIMAAEAVLPAVFAELDPYRAQRPAAPLSPFLPDAAFADLRRPAQPAIFAYLPGAGLSAADLAALEALARAVPVTAHLPGLAAQAASALARAGMRLLQHPLGWEAIARGHSLMLCHGGMGTVSAALVAGMPLAVWPGGIEQRLTGAALAAAGWALPADAALEAAVRDRETVTEARARAAELRARISDPGRVVADRLRAALSESR